MGKLYTFCELSKRSQLLAIGNYIKGWRQIHKNDDLTINDARKLCMDNSFKIAYNESGEIYSFMFFVS